MVKKSNLFRLIFLIQYMIVGIFVASAYDFYVDGIYYEISGSAEVSVTYKYLQEYNSNTYSGNIAIPSSVTYNGKTYTVTAIGGGLLVGVNSLLASASQAL